MKVQYNNLYVHLVFTTFKRLPLIEEKNRVRIEKYITGIINNNGCQLYATYANPEHMCFLASIASKELSGNKRIKRRRSYFLFFKAQAAAHSGLFARFVTKKNERRASWNVTFIY